MVEGVAGTPPGVRLRYLLLGGDHTFAWIPLTVPAAAMMSLLIAFVVGVNIYLLFSFDINSLSSQVRGRAYAEGDVEWGAGRWARACDDGVE